MRSYIKLELTGSRNAQCCCYESKGLSTFADNMQGSYKLDVDLM